MAFPAKLIAEPRERLLPHEACLFKFDASKWGYIVESSFLVWRDPRVAGPVPGFPFGRRDSIAGIFSPCSRSRSCRIDLKSWRESSPRIASA